MDPVQDRQSVAIVGMAGRFPGAPDIDSYWAALLAGRTSLTPQTSDALDGKGVPPDVRADPSYVPVAGALDGIELFDAAYFGIPPAEAAAMDPQHRLLLQEAVHALEHAGWAGRGDDRRVGVFCGAGENRYADLLPAPGSGARTQRGMSDAPAALPLRVSYHLDLRGPSVFVSSLCSTSLTAVHLARRSLLAHECELALAGAVSVQLPQHHGYRAHDGGVMSPDGALHPFDAQARGTVPGSGVGVVVLKRLADAVRDDDTIHAVIRGSALNNDGSDRQSFAAPSVRGQRDVVIAALLDADVDPATIGYVEAHGTGTPLGDPVELAALREARERLGATTPCAVGAVKSSVGHLDTAAGMAGLLKAVLAVREGTVPATVGHDRLNPLIEFGDSGLYVSTGAHPWPLTGHSRRAAVTALGVGGTNAHMVLEEPPPSTGAAAEDDDEPRVFPLSARTPQALDRLRERLAAAVTTPGPALRDAAHTLQQGRTPHPVRRAWVASSRDGLAAALHDRPGDTLSPGPLVLGIGLGLGTSHAVDEKLVRRPPDPHRPQEDAGTEGPEAARAVRTVSGLLDSLADLRIRPHAVAAVNGGEFLALGQAGSLPRDVALRCAGRHLRALTLASTGGDLSACERLLLETERELLACSLAPPDFEVRAPAIGEVFTPDRTPSVEHLLEVTRSVVMGEDEGTLPAECLDVVAAAADRETWLRLLARCWEHGADVRWELIPGSGGGHRVPLPGYPFDEVRHWALPAPGTHPQPLPEPPTAPDSGGADVPAELAEIWRTVLGVPDVRPDDSFFALGGHSLLASQIMARIRERFEVRVPLGDLLDAETLAGMTQLVEDELTAMRVYAASTSEPDHAMETVEL
ncbi:beta-ketoacyl synthase N-terminal-like domain-containing protein [Streptomyces sp. NPDC008092]|uniref:beta-ketoacyl synthase N-terminal-like domain-containing protein n=1 Tax=Streptomyces sp. NPDC008092 TaxID=3364808 RepID=UPI0036E6C905